MSNQSIMLSRFPEEAAHILEKKLQVIEATIVLPCQKHVKNCLLVLLNEGQNNEIGLVFEKDTEYAYRLSGPVCYY